MVKKIIWSKRASDDRDEILNYWFQRNKIKRYSDKLDRIFNHEIDSIKIHPKVFVRTDIKNLRARIIGNYLILFTEMSAAIEILAIWDGRRNPKSHKQHLRTKE